MTKNPDEKLIIELEDRFWNSIMNKDTDVALGLLHEPAFMVSSKGAMKFDHAGYRKMAESDAAYNLLDFRFSEAVVVFPAEDVAILTYQVDQQSEMDGKKSNAKMSASSTWIRKGSGWICAIHTEAPMTPA